MPFLINISNYCDDNTPYIYGKNIDKVINFLEEFSFIIYK